MVKEIHIFLEGGGDGRNSRALIHQGFSSFLQGLVKRARQNKIKWKITVCGSRNNAFRDFKNALKTKPRNAFNVLLVDAEASVGCVPRTFLSVSYNIARLLHLSSQ
ncbi:MAG: hypothetical protein ABFS56_28905 [Pseudomonadota bacterium]